MWIWQNKLLHSQHVQFCPANSSLAFIFQTGFFCFSFLNFNSHSVDSFSADSTLYFLADGLRQLLYLEQVLFSHDTGFHELLIQDQPQGCFSILRWVTLLTHFTELMRRGHRPNGLSLNRRNPTELQETPPYACSKKTFATSAKDELLIGEEGFGNLAKNSERDCSYLGKNTILMLQVGTGFAFVRGS